MNYFNETYLSAKVPSLQVSTLRKFRNLNMFKPKTFRRKHFLIKVSSYFDSLFLQSFFSGLLPLKLESFSPIQFLLSARMMSHFLETIFSERKSGGLFPGLGQALGLLFLAELVSDQL